MRLSSSGHSDVQSSQVRTIPRRSRSHRALTVASTPIRDDFDAYTWTEADHWEAVEEEVYDDQRDRFVSYHRAEMGNMLGEGLDVEPRRYKCPRSASSHTDPLRNLDAASNTTRGVTHRRSGARNIDNEGTLECIGRRVTHRVGKDQQKYELVERRILEDGPERTISIWREEVAKSVTDSAAGDDEPPSVVDSHTDLHKRYGGYPKRSYGNSGRASNNVHRATEKGTAISGSEIVALERSKSPLRMQQQYSSIRSSSPSNRIKSPSVPLSPRSPLNPSMTHSRTRTSSTHVVDTSHNRALTHSSSKATSTSSVELILSTCNPSLLHISPVLSELGIAQEAHLRAIGRMSEDTRDREVREEALNMGVSVVEWAILLDKIQSM